MITPPKKWIFLPVEVKSREFSARVLTAFFAVKKGFGVFIGRNGMNISRTKFPQGIYFDKCLSVHKTRFHHHQVHELGNHLVSLDEEGLLFADEEAYLQNRISQESIDLSSRIFCWGNAQAKIIRDRYSTDHKVLCTGSPRLDLWRPDFSFLHDKSSANIQETYGRFFLIVSNWGFHANEKRAGINPDAPRDRDLSRPFSIDFRPSIRVAFINLIKRLASEFPRETFIVRPHPVDLPDYWSRKESEFPANVKVVLKGSISPWIKAATAIVHNNCTTGVEAFVGGKPTIAFAPRFPGFEKDNLYTMPINELGRVCRTEEEVVHVLDSAEDGEIFNHQQNRSHVAEQYLELDEDQLASERILNELQTLNISPQRFKIPQYGIMNRSLECVADLRWKIRDKLNLSGMFTQAYTRHKNPGLVHEEIAALMAAFEDRFEAASNLCQIHNVERDTFCVFRDE